MLCRFEPSSGCEFVAHLVTPVSLTLGPTCTRKAWSGHVSNMKYRLVFVLVPTITQAWVVVERCRNGHSCPPPITKNHHGQATQDEACSCRHRPLPQPPPPSDPSKVTEQPPALPPFARRRGQSGRAPGVQPGPAAAGAGCGDGGPGEEQHVWCCQRRLQSGGLQVRVLPLLVQSYWMYTVCQLELSSLPLLACGVLVAQRCRTK